MAPITATVLKALGPSWGPTLPSAAQAPKVLSNPSSSPFIIQKSLLTEKASEASRK